MGDENAPILKDFLVHLTNAPNSFAKIQCGTSPRQLWPKARVLKLLVLWSPWRDWPWFTEPHN